jgi:type II secretory pathway pseudopilin PulG
MGIFRSSTRHTHRHAPGQPCGCGRASHRRRLCHFCLSESGVALPVALAVVMVVSALASVAARAAIVSSNQTDRDVRVKQATQAAYAGLQALRYQVNLLQPPSTHCVLKNATTGALTVAVTQSNGWCDPQTEDLGNGASYTARISSGTNITSNSQLLSTRRIVSTGEARGVRRRVALSVNAATGAPIFPPGYAITSLNSVNFGNSVSIVGGLASNGNVTLRNTAAICGPVTPGPGKALTLENSAGVCGGFSTTTAQQDFQLQPVDLEGSTTTNDDARITAAVTGAGSPADTCTSCDQIEWDPLTRVLKLRNDSTLTLSGDVYSFCQLELHNSAQLIIAARDPNSPMKAFIDTPESCGTGLGNAVFRNNTGIVNLNSDPTTFQIRVAGSDTMATSVSFENSFDSTMIMAVYAPNSTVTMQNNLSLIGALAGKQVNLQNNTQLTYHERIGDIASGSSLRVYNDQDYVECAVDVAGALPDDGC